MTIRLPRLLFRLIGIGFLAYLGIAGYQWANEQYTYWRYPLKYESAIVESAHKNNLDPYLVAAVIRTESRFRPESVSSRGARGLMQLMPSTAVWAAEQMQIGDVDPDQLFDPELNIAIGSWYLAELQKQFNGSLLAALAAYNGGSRNVQDWMSNGIWDGSYAQLDQIPFRESRNFVDRVLDDYQMYAKLYEGRLE